MKKGKLLWMGLLLVICTGIFFGKWQREQKENVQQQIAEKILRFHVVANSDTEEDQRVKRKVKDAVLEQLKPLLADCQDAEQTIRQIQAHETELRGLAGKIVRREGHTDSVQTQLSETYFPTKTYGDCIFPAGIYQAFQIQIGKAEGHNWWCVLYPNLCFVDSIHAVVPAEEKKKLKDTLSEEEYESLFDWKNSSFKITTKWLPHR